MASFLRRGCPHETSTAVGFPWQAPVRQTARRSAGPRVRRVPPRGRHAPQAYRGHISPVSGSCANVTHGEGPRSAPRRWAAPSVRVARNCMTIGLRGLAGVEELSWPMRGVCAVVGFEGRQQIVVDVNGHTGQDNDQKNVGRSAKRVFTWQGHKSPRMALPRPQQPHRGAAVKARSLPAGVVRCHGLGEVPYGVPRRVLGLSAACAAPNRAESTRTSGGLVRGCWTSGGPIVRALAARLHGRWSKPALFLLSRGPPNSC